MNITKVFTHTSHGLITLMTSTLWNFPNCFGALDGKRFTKKAAPNSSSLYFNYKKKQSIIFLALVDAQYNFIAIDVGAH